ncbi:class I SAM-dependent methyltransferase [Streptomyces sp. NPDC057638]|uniref:class I SAM-dependent methyltransferase n=1 Tax=Streptomyces sp. NPDC057638 TaxID=3346190 RepID=UPI00368C4122
MTHELFPALTATDWDAWHRSPAAEERVVNAERCFAELAVFFSRTTPCREMVAVDLGCGTGAWTQLLVDWGITHTTGLDFSTVALKKAASRPVSSTPRYDLWDATTDPLPARNIDVITCRYLWEYLDPATEERLLDLIRQSLKPVMGALYLSFRTATTTDPFQRGLTDERIDRLSEGWLRQDRFTLGPSDGALYL